MAIACFLFLTVPPLPRLPDFRVLCFLRLIALATVFCAVFPYLAIVSPILIVPCRGFNRTQMLYVRLANFKRQILYGSRLG